jgi:uncharacterized Zn finger protein (UPF0148 family)
MAKSNCDNCGAPLAYDGGLHCDYCGTVFERPDEAFEETILYSNGEPVFKMTERGLMSLNEARMVLQCQGTM